MKGSHIVLIVLTGFSLMLFLMFMGSLYPSTSGIVANSTLVTNSTACSHCDSGIKTIGQNLPVFLIGILIASLITVVVVVAKKL